MRQDYNLFAIKRHFYFGIIQSECGDPFVRQRHLICFGVFPRSATGLADY